MVGATIKKISSLSIAPLAMLIAAFVCLGGCRGGFYFFTTAPSKARIADQYAENGEYERAIESYLGHIDDRLWDPSRPETENPYFYYLLIGDLYLKLNQPDRAEQSYAIAKQKGISQELILDRVRRVAHWFEDHEQYERAILLLEQYRDFDPLSFDIDIDRIHRKLVAKDQK